MNWNAWPSVLWVEGVNYYFDSSIRKHWLRRASLKLQWKDSMQIISAAQTKHAFLDAAKQWESHTCINFTENPAASDRVKVSSLSGCYSHVGRIGGEQPGHNGDYGKYIPKTNDNFGLLYDYGSIMHYAAAE
ncbi:astacin [Teladorsagia circumcincta]|uniref:Astacin n=1 Tax=Teladorsagia circumcincta TaxID=45464 RepID=A0A2G9TP45_TELCI|nr:astacin [Teladorsagia circumcincta]